MTLKELSLQKWEYDCKNSMIAKTHGKDYVPKDKFKDTDEKGLMNCIEWYCFLNNAGMFWRTPNKSSQVGKKKTISSTTEEIISGIGVTKDAPIWGYSSATDGLSDMAGFLIIYRLPVSVALEIKIPGDTWKQNQKEFAQNVRSAGGIYIIVQDFADFFVKLEDVYKKINELKTG